MLVKCTCGNREQDAMHGEGVRVMNATTKKIVDDVIYRCTVCGKETTAKGRTK